MVGGSRFNYRPCLCQSSQYSSGLFIAHSSGETPASFQKPKSNFLQEHPYSLFNIETSNHRRYDHFCDDFLDGFSFFLWNYEQSSSLRYKMVLDWASIFNQLVLAKPILNQTQNLCFSFWDRFVHSTHAHGQMRL